MTIGPTSFSLSGSYSSSSSESSSRSVSKNYGEKSHNYNCITARLVQSNQRLLILIV